MRVVLLFVLGCISLVASEDIALEVTLRDALKNVGDDRSRTRPAYILVRKVADRWQPALVLGDRYNANYGLGFVRSAELSDDTITITFGGHISDDPWVKGGWGNWSVSLSKQANGEWSGTHTGLFAAQPVSGTAHARVDVLPPVDQAALTSQTGPRLLLTAADIPRLRDRLATPFGQAAVEQMTNAPGLALRYALTGDEALALAAMEKTKEIIEDPSSGSKHVAHRVWSWRLMAVAIAYDCAKSAWPAEFRAQTRTWMEQVLERIYFQHQTWTEYTGFAIGHRFSGFFLGAAGVGSLALLGEPGDTPRQPIPYLGGRDPQLPLDPITEVAAELPVFPLVPEAVPQQWTYVGGLLPDGEDVIVKQLEQHLAQGLKPGIEIAAQDTAHVVAALPTEAFRHGGVDITKANKHTYFSENWLSTNVRVTADQAGWYRFKSGYDAGVNFGANWLAGISITDGDVFQLQAGDYPLVIQTRIAQTNPWGMIQVKPRFVRITEAEVQESLAFIALTEELQQEQYRQMLSYHQDTNGASPVAWQYFAVGEALNAATIRHIIGDGGFQGHLQDPNFILENIFRFPALYRNATGRNLGSIDQIEAYLPRLLFSRVYQEDGDALVQNMTGPATMVVKDWFDPARDIAPELFACLYPTISSDLQPAMHALWNQHLGVSDAETAKKVLKDNLGAIRHQLDWDALDLHTVFAFVNYPLEQQPGTLAEMPHTWEAPGFGWYASRNAFEQGDDAVLQIFARTRPGIGKLRQNAGALRLLALGQTWWTGPNGGTPHRFLESLPRPANGEIPNAWAHGQLIAKQFDGAGTGSLAIDLADAYKPIEDDIAYISHLGKVLNRDALGSSDVIAKRITGVDWSGKSGAPVLMVVADQLTGVEDPRWVYHVETLRERYGRWEIIDSEGKMVKRKDKKKVWRGGVLPDGYTTTTRKYAEIAEEWKPSGLADISIDNNQFTITRGDVTLVGTVIAETPVTLEVATNHQHEQLLQAKNNHHDYRMTTWGVDVKGADKWIVVMTVQRGAAPTVTHDGFGKPITVGDQVITVSSETISFQSP